MALLWVLLIGIIYFVNPATFGVILLFFLILFFCLLFTFSLLFGNTRRGVIGSLTLLTFLILRYLDIGHVLNFILLVGLGITIELYFSRK
jgi:hypothetical protein